MIEVHLTFLLGQLLLAWRDDAFLVSREWLHILEANLLNIAQRIAIIQSLIWFVQVHELLSFCCVLDDLNFKVYLIRFFYYTVYLEVSLILDASIQVVIIIQLSNYIFTAIFIRILIEVSCFWLLHIDNRDFYICWLFLIENHLSLRLLVHLSFTNKLILFFLLGLKQLHLINLFFFKLILVFSYGLCWL